MTSPPRELDTDCGARVVKSVDTRDLKSLDVRVVPVRFRPRAPLKLKKKPYRLNRYDASLRRFCFCSPAFSLCQFSFLVHFLSKRLTTSCDSLQTICPVFQHSQGRLVGYCSGLFRGLSLVLRQAWRAVTSWPRTSQTRIESPLKQILIP